MLQPLPLPARKQAASVTTRICVRIIERNATISSRNKMTLIGFQRKRHTEEFTAADAMEFESSGGPQVTFREAVTVTPSRRSAANRTSKRKCISKGLSIVGRAPLKTAPVPVAGAAGRQRGGTRWANRHRATDGRLRKISIRTMQRNSPLSIHNAIAQRGLQRKHRAEESTVVDVMNVGRIQAAKSLQGKQLGAFLARTRDKPWYG